MQTTDMNNPADLPFVQIWIYFNGVKILVKLAYTPKTAKMGAP